MPAFREGRVLHEKHKFLIAVDNVASAEFNKCSALSQKVEKIEYREGGALIPYKVPGLVSFDDITLERGTSDNTEFHTWMLDVANIAAGDGGRGAAAPAFRRDLSIRQLRRDNATTRIWDVYGAWPVEYRAGEWDNDANEVVIENLVLTFDFYNLASD